MWPWPKRSLPLQAPQPDYTPLTVGSEQATPKIEGIEVEEVDTSDMTKTGIHRAWDRMTGGFKE